MFDKKRVAVTVIVVVAVFAALAAVIYFFTAPSDETLVAAYVGDTTISEDEIVSYTEEFRESNGYTDDDAWRSYLSSEELDAKTWREEVIAQFANEILIRQKAAELGFTVDEDAVDEKIEELKEYYGIDEGDEEAWAEQLEELGTTEEELRETYEFSNLESQVFSEELPLELAEDDETMQTFIKENLANIVTRKLAAIVYDTKKEAKAALAELKELSDDELAERFAQLANESNGTDDDGNVGWDLQTDFTSIDEDSLLTKLSVGELADAVFQTDDGYAVFMCTDKFTFEGDTAYDDIEDEDLQSYVLSYATSSYWSSECENYLSELRDEANIQVAQMPVGLPYDVDNVAESESE